MANTILRGKSLLKTAQAVVSSAFVAASTVVANAASTADYVRQGLIAMWDGYENDGVGGHSTELTEWKDTSGTYSFVFNENSGVTVDGNAIFFPGKDVGYAKLDADGTDATFEAAKDGTCEIVILSNPLTSYSVALQSSAESGIALGAWQRGSATAAAQIVTSSNGNRPSASYNWSSQITTLSTTYTSALSQGTWANGTKLSSSDQRQWSYPSDETIIGHRALLSTGQYFKGRIYAIRLYSTKLTAEQMAANASVDHERFVEGNVKAKSGVLVSGDPLDYAAGGVPTYGFVEKSVDETVEMSAPEMIEVSDGVRAYCAGWELYDYATGELVDKSTDVTRLKCAFTYEKPVSLVWRWDVRHAISATAASGLTVTPSVCWVLGDEPAVFTVSGTDCPVWSGVGIDDRFAKTVTVRSTEPTTVSVSGGATIAVPGVAATIEDALAMAQPGDIIALAPDDYTLASTDGIVVPQNVTLKGTGADPSETTVSTPTGTGSASLVTVTGGRLENITFTGARCNNDVSVPRVLSASGGAFVTNCVFTGHTTSSKGNLVLVTGEGTRVVDTTISEAAFSGGGNSVSGHAVRILDKAVVSDTVIDNVDMRVGATSAGVVLSGGAQLLRSTVRRCDVYTMETFNGRAGGVCIDSSGTGCLVDGCVIEENSITTDQAVNKQYKGAGGLSVNATAIVRNTVIQNNTSGNAYCGGVWLSGAGTLENCLIAGNKVTAPINYAASVAGIYALNASAVLKHVTVVGNELASVGSNIKAHGAYLNGAQAVNSIFWGNGPAATAASSMNLAVAGATGCVTCSLVSSEAEWLNASNAKSGEGCVKGDPLFTDAATGDYTVGSLSPAVDSGDPKTGVVEDIRGIARPKNFGFDMGCYECEYAVTYECSIAPILQYVGAKGGTVRFAGNASMAKDVERMVWTVTAASGDAPAGGEGLACDITFPAGANVYTISLTTYWNGGHEASATESATVRVTGGVALAPGGDLVATLAQMQGLSADNPVTVSLAEGLYTAENSGVKTDDGWMFAVPAGVVLRGAGEGKTVLDGGAARCVLQVFAGGIATDLTVTNALSAGTAASGYFVDVAGGTIRNVTVDGCRAKCSTRSGQHAVCVSQGGLMTGCTVKDIWNTPPNNTSSYGAILLNLDGTVTNSTIVGNKSVDKSYGNVSLFGDTALMTDCLVCSNYAYNTEWRSYGAGGVALNSSAVLRNSVIVGNVSDRSAGGSFAGGVLASGATVENCRIEENAANWNGENTTAAGVLLKEEGVCRNCLVANNVLTASGNISGSVTAAGVCMADITRSNVHIDPELVNCTIIGNMVMGSVAPKAGLALDGGIVRNAVIWNNVGLTNGVTEVANTAAATNGWRTVAYTCTTPLVDGEGNINGDPQLSVRKARFGQIKSSSPCVDAGDPMGWTEDDVDLLGNPRLRKNKIDIGCYQAILSGLILMVK